MKDITTYAINFNRTQYEDIAFNFSNIGNVEARYIETTNLKHRGHRLIAALPPMRTFNDSIDDFFVAPYWTADVRTLPAQERLQQVINVKDFRLARDFFCDIDRAVYFALLNCYQECVPNPVPGSDPDNPGFYIRNKITVPGTLIIGDSGAGKTTGIRHAINYFPSFITHDMEDEMMIQIPIINVNCPPDGSIKSFWDNCIDEVERILNRKVVIRRSKETANDKERVFKHLVFKFNIGLVVVDEIQNLVTKNADLTLKHFLVASNEMTLPFIFVGTNEFVKYIGDKAFYNLRRMGDEVYVNRFEKDDAAGMWDNFITTLWKYQWTREPIPLTEEMKDLFYNESGGLPDRVISLFMNMQIAAIENGIDTACDCTVDWIRNVSKTTYSLSRDKLNTLAKYGNKTDKKLPADLRDYRPIMTDETSKRPICEIAQINDAIKADSCKKHIDNMKSNVINNVGSFIGNTYSYRELCKVFDELNREFNLLELGEKKTSMKMVAYLQMENDSNEERKNETKKKKDRKKKVALSELNSFNGISNKSK